jgi:PadR family transcriptional regulator AphA
MSLDYILLGLLRKPASGYDLKTVFDERIHYFWAAELSQIYPTLQRLERKGWLHSRSAHSKRGAGKRLYHTTPAGRRALRAWLRNGPQFGDERFPFLAQVYFLNELADLGQTLRFFSRMREHFVHKLEGLHNLERWWMENDPRYPDRLPPEEFHWLLALRKGLLSLEAHVKWCNESIRRIRARMSKERRRARSS